MISVCPCEKTAATIERTIASCPMMTRPISLFELAVGLVCLSQQFEIAPASGSAFAQWRSPETRSDEASSVLIWVYSLGKVASDSSFSSSWNNCDCTLRPADDASHAGRQDHGNSLCPTIVIGGDVLLNLVVDPRIAESPLESRCRSQLVRLGAALLTGSRGCSGSKSHASKADKRGPVDPPDGKGQAGQFTRVLEARLRLLPVRIAFRVEGRRQHEHAPVRACGRPIRSTNNRAWPGSAGSSNRTGQPTVSERRRTRGSEARAAASAAFPFRTEINRSGPGPVSAFVPSGRRCTAGG